MVNSSRQSWVFLSLNSIVALCAVSHVAWVQAGTSSEDATCILANGSQDCSEKLQTEQRPDWKKQAVRALATEEKAREALANGNHKKAAKLFKSAILFGTAAFSVGTDQFVIRERLHDIIISAKVHLGFVSEMQKAYSECVEYYSDAYNDNPYALNGSFLHTLIPSYDTEATLLVARRFVNRYASCLYHKHRSGEVRGLYKNATAAGAFRNEWQCSVALSPTEWALRAQGWWDLRELDVDSRELVKIVRKNLKTIRTEAITVMVERKAPQGVKVELNQEASAVKQGTWLELIAFKGGRQVASACAALPKTCHLLHHFVSSFHGRGHVKISQFTGGTASLPHCGTEDSKLRMHIPVLVPPSRRAELLVQGRVRTWVEGRALVFDDSFEHTATFDADESAVRLVLIIDLWHPGVPFRARQDTNG